MTDDDSEDRALVAATKVLSSAQNLGCKPRRGPDGCRQFESELEMAERHVAEGEIRVSRQCEIILRLRERGANPELAEALLDQFEDSLAHARDYLAQLRAEKDGAGS